MKTKIFSILFALLLVASLSLMTAVPAAAYIGTTYYVSTTGDNANDGLSWETALRDIQFAIYKSYAYTIYVAAGTYYEHITLINGVRVLGAGAGISIIDGSSTGTVVYANSVGSTTKLDGFTITHGSATNGGGMYNENYSSPTVTDCTFSTNSAYNGGGMCNYDNSSPTVTNCTFSGNSATNYGGGMYNQHDASPSVTNCTFSLNSAFNGGGTCNYDNSSPTVTNCTFSGNTANYNGGGMCNTSYSSPTVTNCTFSGNTATNYGGGMYNWSYSSPTVTNCILWGDSSQEIYNSVDLVPVVTYCDIQGGYSGTGNINADPLFVGGSNYHLTSGSPCIDVGYDSAPSLPSTDFEGDPRNVDGNGNGLAMVDMGADEYAQTDVWVNISWASLDPGDPADGHIFGYDAFDTINDGVAAVANGGIVHVYPGLYNEPPTVINKSLTLESVSGDWDGTVIDNLIDAEIVITDPAGPFTGNATISGFTITGGTCGIAIEGLADTGTVTIEDCLIYNNGTDIYGAGTLDGDISIDDCIIAGSKLADTGIHLDYVAGTVSITDSFIGAYYDSETATPYSGNFGDGIDIGTISATGSVLIDNNKIVGNTGSGIADGISGGCYGQFTITNNVIGAYDYDLTSGAGNFTGNGGYGISIDYVGETGVITIDGNKIAQNYMDGIEFGSGSPVEGDVTINNNIIGAWTQDDGVNSHQYTGNGHKGINVFYMVTSTGSMTITNNKIAENSGTESNTTGVYINRTEGDTTITGNYVGSWTQDIPGGAPVTYNGNAGPGIMIQHVPAGSLLIQGNNVTGNTSMGIYVADTGLASGAVTIDGNVIDDNGTGGNGIYLFGVHDATISGNTITRHIEGTAWLAGICVDYSDNNTISQNTITGNWVGVYITYNANGNIVENNNISDNAMDGIYIGGDDNEILGNVISGNAGAHALCGIYLEADALGNVIKFNNITDNTETSSYGVYNDNIIGEDVDATNNWWGDVSGPGGFGPGTGDAVSNDVNYAPWLGAPLELPAAHHESLGAGTYTVDASDEANTEVTLTTIGDTEIYVAEYESQPFSDEPFPDEALGKFIDIYVSNPGNVVWPIYVELSYTDGEAAAGIDEDTLGLYYYESVDTFYRCSDTGVDTGENFIWANVTAEEAGYLGGTPFGGGGSPAVAHPVGGGGDTTSPTISNVSHCDEGVTETTADICWITDEQGTSQVEYEASPGKLSPLDTRYVTEHHVQLTGLTPCTTYSYRTMSRDRAGNLAVSDEYTFTTLGEATFTSSDLSISPGEVSAGDTVNISVVVTNTGSCLSSYTVTLKINDVVEATKDITVNASASKEVAFTTAKDEAGNYSVDVDGLSGSFTVKEEVTPAAGEEATSTTVNWPLVGGIIAGVVVIGLIILFVVRRRAA